MVNDGPAEYPVDKLAPLSLRAAAFLRTSLMVFIVGLGATLLNASCFPVDAYLQIRYKLSPDLADKLAAILLWMPACLWFLADGVQNKASYGMMKTGLAFRAKNGAAVGRLRCLARLAAGLLTLPLLPVSALAVLLDANRRGLADHICGTMIVEAADPDSSILAASGVRNVHATTVAPLRKGEHPG